MQKITQEEFNKMEFAHHNISVPEILKLEVGEMLKIEKEEWKNKYSPINMLCCIGRGVNKKFSGKTLTDGSGWIVIRIK